MLSIAKNADRLEGQAAQSASRVRANLILLGAETVRLINNIRESEHRGVESILWRMGLRSRRSNVLRSLAWFAAGAVVAGGAALLLAPMRGRDLVGRLSKSLRGVAQTAREEARGITNGPT